MVTADHRGSSGSSCLPVFKRTENLWPPLEVTVSSLLLIVGLASWLHVVAQGLVQSQFNFSSNRDFTGFQGSQFVFTFSLTPSNWRISQFRDGKWSLSTIQSCVEEVLLPRLGHTNSSRSSKGFVSTDVCTSDRSYWWSSDHIIPFIQHYDG